MGPDSGLRFTEAQLVDVPGRGRDMPPRMVPPMVATNCPECEGPVREVCGRCHHPIPPGWRDIPTVTIAMAGARASGKSLYVGVALAQLRQLATNSGSILEPADVETMRTFEERYMRPLYAQMRGMPATPSAEAEDAYQRAPLMWVWSHSQDGPKFGLAIRDVAGEDLESGATGRQFEFFGLADAVFFLFDPMRITSIREKLHGLIPEQNNVGGDPLRVLNSVKMNIGAGRPRIALILSKFDALQTLRDVQDNQWREVMGNRGAAFNREIDNPFSGYDEEDGQLLHHEVIGLLELLDGIQLLNGLGALEHRLFAVSTLGEATKGAALSKHGISPYRCLDPMRWAIDGVVGR